MILFIWEKVLKYDDKNIIEHTTAYIAIKNHVRAAWTSKKKNIDSIRVIAAPRQIYLLKTQEHIHIEQKHNRGKIPLSKVDVKKNIIGKIEPIIIPKTR